MYDNSTFLLFLVALILLSSLGKRSRVRYRHLRGLRLSSLWQVRTQLMPWQNAPQTVVWGRFRLPLALANQYFFVAGTIGSGKTLMLRLLMQSVFPWIGQGQGQRALVYDGKGDLLNIILGMKPDYQTVFTFDPFDSQGVRWDIAADVTDDAAANQTARLLFPKQDGEHQPFFPESVQNLAAALMLVLLERAGRQWRLSHLLYIMRSPARIQATLALTEKGRDTLSQFIHSGETWGNITAVISNRINDYEIVAALWDHAPNAVSIKEWNETESILVLRKNQDCSEVIDAMNRVLLAVAKRRLLSKPETPDRRTWIILDELASLGGKAISKELHLLMEQGRSRNVCVALGFQNIAALHDEFGHDGADRLIGLCSIKALLRFEDQRSAEWASGFFGKQEVRVESVSVTQGGGGGGAPFQTSTSTSYQDKERWTVMPSEFMATARTDAKRGLSGYFLVPEGDPPLAFRDKIPARWLFGKRGLAPIAERVENRRPDVQQRLAVTEADIQQLLHGGAAAAVAGATPAQPAATSGGSGAAGVMPAVPAPPPSVGPSGATTPATTASAAVPVPAATPVPATTLVPAATSPTPASSPLASRPRRSAPSAGKAGGPTLASVPPVQTTAAVTTTLATPLTFVVPPAPVATIVAAASPAPAGSAAPVAVSPVPASPASAQKPARRRAAQKAGTGPVVTASASPPAPAPGTPVPPPTPAPTPITPSIWNVGRTI